MNTETFGAGFDPAAYVGVLRNYRSFVRSHMGEANANAEHIAALNAVVAAKPQPVRATIMTEDWCGDSACNLPILTSLFAGADVELRIFRGCENDALHDYYNNVRGIDHIPVLSIWDGRFNEICTWIEAPAAVTAKKDAWKAERPEFMDLYRRKATDREAARKFFPLYAEFMDLMISWYQSGMWDETTREIVEALRA